MVTEWTMKLTEADDNIKELQLALSQTEGKLKVVEEGRIQLEVRKRNC